MAVDPTRDTLELDAWKATLQRTPQTRGLSPSFGDLWPARPAPDPAARDRLLARLDRLTGAASPWRESRASTPAPTVSRDTRFGRLPLVFLSAR